MPRKVRVLCEGISDRDSLREILQKERLNVRVIQLYSKPRLLKKMNSYISDNGYIDTFIIVVDSHCTDPSITYDEVYSKVEGSNINKVKIHVIKHALETWFLAEDMTIRSRFNVNFKLYPNPDNFCKPDEILTDLLRKARIIKYHKSTHAKMIPEQLNTGVLKDKSKNFRNFIDLIKNAQLD